MHINYWVKRLLWTLPVLLLVAVFTFMLSKWVPGDPVLLYMNLQSERKISAEVNSDEYYAIYHQTARRYGLDLPVFYFSLTPRCLTPQIGEEENLMRRNRWRKLTLSFGNALLVEEFMSAREAFIDDMMKQERLSAEQKRQLFELDKAETRETIQQSLSFWAGQAIASTESYRYFLERWRTMQSYQPSWKDFMPSFSWHGSRNQFHSWFASMLRGDMGTSLQDGRPVIDKLVKALSWTLPINVAAWLLIIIISILIGAQAAARPQSKTVQYFESSLLVIHAMPLFWLSTLAVIYLTGSAWWQVFPSPGSSAHLFETSFLPKLWKSFLFILLPLICIVLSSIAALSRQIRHLLTQELEKNYIAAAYLRGIPFKKILWRYALPNALIPMTAYVGRIIPALLSGSVIIESIFNIPGLGKLLVSASLARDWNVAFSIFLLGTLLTILGVILSDALLYKLSPRSSQQLNAS